MKIDKNKKKKPEKQKKKKKNKKKYLQFDAFLCNLLSDSPNVLRRNIVSG